MRSEHDGKIIPEDATGIHRDCASQDWHRRVPWGQDLQEISGFEILDTVKRLLEHNDVPHDDDRPVVCSLREKSHQELKRLQHRQKSLLEERNGLKSEIQTLEHTLTARIQVLKDEAKAQTLVLQTRIDTIQTEHDALALHAKSRQKEIRACDVALSPARGLPIDILQELALWNLPKEPRAALDEVPLNFSMVCASWRSAVLSMPRLWSTLYVRTGHQPYRWIKDPIQEAKNILTDFTSHAGGRALTVHLSLVCDHEREIADSYAKTYDFLVWVLYKWPLISNVQHLTILSVYAWKDILVMHGPLSLPNLETVILTTHRRRQESPPEDTRFWIEGIFNNSPRLHQITLDRGVLSMPHKFLPLSQLESLVLEDPITTPTFLELLDACTELKSGYFNISQTVLLEPHEGPLQIRCRHLQELQVVFCDRDPVFMTMSIFRHRRLPSLRRLVSRCVRRWDRAMDIPTFQNPLDLSPYLPNFSEFTIIDSWQWPLPFLLNNTTVTSIEMRLQPNQIIGVASQLTVTDGKVSLLPSLMNLKMWLPASNSCLSMLDCDELGKMLHSRILLNYSTGVAQLKSFQLRGGGIVGEVESRLQEIKESLAPIGVEVTFYNEAIEPNDRYLIPNGIGDGVGPDRLGYLNR